jgi:hypothetical protein
VSIHNDLRCAIERLKCRGVEPVAIRMRPDILGLFSAEMTLYMEQSVRGHDVPRGPFTVTQWDCGYGLLTIIPDGAIQTRFSIDVLA